MCYPDPTEINYKRLSEENPEELVSWIESGELESYKITFAAEYLGKCGKPEIAVPCLIRLLDNESSLVKEGAIYGIENFLDYPGVKEKLEGMAQNDQKQTIRDIAKEALILRKRR